MDQTNFNHSNETFSLQKQIITDIFTLTGLKITEDDPIVALLIYQDKQLSAHKRELSIHDDQFFINFDKRMNKVSQIYEALESHKNSMLMEITFKNKQLVNDECKKQFEQNLAKKYKFVKPILFGLLITQVITLLMLGLGAHL